MSCCYCLPMCRCLGLNEQLRLTGCTKSSVVNGPGCFCIGPCQSYTRTRGIALEANQFVKVKDIETTQMRIEKGPQLYFLGANEESQGVETATSLSSTQYAYVFNSIEGTYTTIKGPKIWFPSNPFENLSGGIRDAISLKSNEYIRIEDSQTGNVKVERGEKVIYLENTEMASQGVEKAINIDSQSAVVVRNTKNGQVKLCVDKGLFFPGNYEVIESVQKRITLQDQHTIILKDQHGNYHFRTGGSVHRGGKVDKKDLKMIKEGSSKKKRSKEESVTSEDSRAFFLPPFWEVAELIWAVGVRKEKTKKITVIDQRPHQMSYLFVCRTADSVELEIDCSFYWQIYDVEKMIATTQNPTADICFHARSVISQAVSQLTLDKFMTNFNQIVNNAMLAPEDDFYENRGLVVHSAEMRSLHCKDPSTEAVLQEIIKETTLRLNRLQKQTSDNEVKLLAVQGSIEHEKLNGELLDIRRKQKLEDKINSGEAEAQQIGSFFSKFGGVDKLNSTTALDIWHVLRRNDSIKELANGASQLYVTPDDVSLHLNPKKR